MLREKDFIKRLVESLGLLLARALGLRRQGRFDEALDVLRSDSHALLGLPRDVLDALDAKSAAQLLKEPERIRAYAKLLEEEAAILDEAGRGGAGSKARAEELLALAR